MGNKEIPLIDYQDDGLRARTDVRFAMDRPRAGSCFLAINGRVVVIRKVDSPYSARAYPQPRSGVVPRFCGNV